MLTNISADERINISLSPHPHMNQTLSMQNYPIKIVSRPSRDYSALSVRLIIVKQIFVIIKKFYKNCCLETQVAKKMFTTRCG